MYMNGTNTFFRMTLTFRVMRTTFRQTCSQTTGIEVLGTPIGTDAYIKNFVTENSIKIMKDVEKLEPLTDAFTHFQLIKMTQNTHTIHEW